MHLYGLNLSTRYSNAAVSSSPHYYNFNAFGIHTCFNTSSMSYMPENRLNQQPPPPFTAARETTFTPRAYQGQYQEAPLPTLTSVQHNREVTNTESDDDCDSNSPGEVSQKYLNVRQFLCIVQLESRSSAISYTNVTD